VLRFRASTAQDPAIVFVQQGVEETMSQLFSTELLPASDRIDAWQWNAKQICGDCLIQLPRASFHGTIDVRDVGGLRLTRFSSSPLSFSKWPSDSPSAENRFCIVITQIAGVRRYVQNGTSVLLYPGDSTLIDSGHPWSSACSTDCARLYLRVPHWLMENHLRRTDIPLAQRISGGERLGATLCRLSQSLYEEARRMQVEESAAALEAYFEILSACFGGNSGSIPRGAELRGQIQRYIAAHLSECTLDAAEIASATGISVRHLHRLFLVTGATLGDYLRTLRLTGCRSDLANPGMKNRTITEIAFGWGFSDSAHFSHSFRKQFGLSPRAFRSQAASETSRSDEPALLELPPAATAEGYWQPN
jgi:AraC family transcriptional activator of tynA and feaB